MGYQHIEVIPLTPTTGAEIRGVDLSKPMPAPVLAEVWTALRDHLMVFFRGQKLDADSFGAFGRQLGELHEEPFIPKLEGKEGIHHFRGVDPNKLTVQTLKWHVDHSYAVQPTKAAALYAVDVPASGGDTLFANMYSAYAALSPEMKRIVDPLYAVHDILHYGISSGHHSLATPKQIDMLKVMREKFPQVEHPIVCRHPETDKPYLFINPCWVSGIRGLTADESRGLLEFLNAHTTKPEFQCRFHWENGTVGMWDNRCVLHSPIGDHIGRRAMLRLAIGADEAPLPYRKAA
jgi:taurine dioxygenase